MIRTHAILFKINNSQLGVTLGWHDPEKKMLRSKMMQTLVEGIKAFETRCRLSGASFDVESLCEFMSKRAELGDNLDKVFVIDATLGLGAEWTRPATIKVENVLPELDMSEVVRRARQDFSPKG